MLAANQAIENVLRVFHELRLDSGRSLETDFGQAVAMVPGVLLKRAVADFGPSRPVPIVVVSVTLVHAWCGVIAERQLIAQVVSETANTIQRRIEVSRLIP